MVPENCSKNLLAPFAVILMISGLCRLARSAEGALVLPETISQKNLIIVPEMSNPLLDAHASEQFERMAGFYEVSKKRTPTGLHMYVREGQRLGDYHTLKMGWHVHPEKKDRVLLAHFAKQEFLRDRPIELETHAMAYQLSRFESPQETGVLLGVHNLSPMAELPEISEEEHPSEYAAYVELFNAWVAAVEGRKGYVIANCSREDGVKRLMEAIRQPR